MTGDEVAGVVDDTLGVLLKYQDDVARMKGPNVAAIVDRVGAEAS